MATEHTNYTKAFLYYWHFFHAHLVEWVRENWPIDSTMVEVRPESQAASQPGASHCRTVFLHFDHMRSRASYSKTIANWSRELGIVGRLVFCDKLIIASMQGNASDIKVVFSR